MILILLEACKKYTLHLPEKVSGKYSIDHINVYGKNEPVVFAEGINGKWELTCSVYAKFADKSDKQTAEDGTIDIIIDRTKAKAVVVAESDEKAYSTFFKKRISAPCEITVGSHSYDTICFDSSRLPLIDKMRISIAYSDNKFTLTDFDGRVYTDNNAAHTGDIPVGTQIYAGGVILVIGRDYICCNYRDHIEKLDSNILCDFYAPERQTKNDHSIADEKADNLFYCSPRFCRINEKVEIKIEPPPSKVGTDTMPAIFSIGPSLTMGMASVATASFSVINNINNGGEMMNVAPTIIMAGSMVAGSVMWPLISKGAEKKRNKKKEHIRTAAYAEYIKKLKKNIELAVEAERNLLISSNPEMSELLRRIEYRDRSLWERVSGQADFLSFIAGKGCVDASIELDFNEKNFTMESDPLYDLAAELFNDKPVIENVPVTISMRDDYILGIIGERSEAEAYTRDIVMQTAALQSYDEVRFVVICSEEDYHKWEFMRWLPHTSGKNEEIRFLAADTEDMKLVSSELERQLTNGADSAYIIISCDRKLAAKTAFISKILNSDKYCGFSLITLYDEMKYLPKECRKVINVSENTAELHSSDGSVNNIAVLPHISYEQCYQSAVSLANIQLAKSDRSFELPNMITFMELMGAVKCEHLNCAQRWRDNNPVNSLKTPIGIDENGDICYLDLHQDGHGPHGLVAGMTGSGKSEFIMTYILSLAVNYSPEEVSFILIDYKGGGMSNAFGNLPHLAGMITNLDGTGITRALVSIESELKRREHIFSETGDKLEITNLDIYKYQKLYRQGMVSEPMSHLFIISDEFAELKSQQPEFMDKLISTARIGRSLGVHLILATQKPSGVVSDQIWSNSRFKVCLKVQDAADSTDMIKRPDAAALTKTGRFYLQVGYNEVFLMGQSAWCGAVYRPDEESHISSDVGITVIDRCGRKIVQSSAVRIESRSANPSEDEKPSKQLDAVLKYIEASAKSEGVLARPMWLPALPPELYLDDIAKQYSVEEKPFSHYADIAIYDAPESQEQKLLSVSPLENGNIALYGSAGSGKSSFLMSMICSMAKKYSPNEVNFYIIDFGSETLLQLKSLSHVGEVIIPSSADRIKNLMTFIKRQAAIRKKLFAEHNGEYHIYCEKKEQVPEIIVVINNYSAFIDYLNGFFDASLLQLGKLGISFIVTASLVNALGFSILQNFKQKLVTQLNDDAYSIILSKVGRLRPSPYKGRGIVQIGDKAYEFQSAFAAKAEDRFEYFKELCKQKSVEYGEAKAARIPVLPKYYTCSYACSNGLSNISLNAVPVGLTSVEAEPVGFNFTEKFTVIANKAVFDGSMIQGLAELLSMYYGRRLTVIDCSGLFVNCEMNYTYSNCKENFEAGFKTVFDEILNRYNNYRECERSGRQPPKYEKMAILFVGLGKFMASLGSEVSQIKQDITDALELVGINHNVRYIIYERISDISALNVVRSFAERTNQASYIWAGDGYTEQYVLPTVRPDAKAEDILNGGYVVSRKKISCVKLICSENEKENDDEQGAG